MDYISIIDSDFPTRMTVSPNDRRANRSCNTSFKINRFFFVSNLFVSDAFERSHTQDIKAGLQAA